MSDSLPQGPPPADTFPLGSTTWLRRRGLRGRLRASLSSEGLVLQGERGGSTPIHPSEVERLRSIQLSSRQGVFYVTRLWVRGEIQPLFMSLHHSMAGPYLKAMEGLALLVAAEGGLQRLERGSSVFRALLPLMLLGPLLPASLVVSILALGNDPWYLRFAPTLIGLAMAVVGVLVTRSEWPRTVGDFDEYHRALHGLRAPRTRRRLAAGQAP